MEYPWSTTAWRFKVMKLVGTVMVTIFCDADGDIVVDFLTPRRTISGDYALLLEQVQVAIAQKSRGS